MRIVQIQSITVSGIVILYALDDSGTVWQQTYDIHGAERWVRSPEYEALKKQVERMGV